MAAARFPRVVVAGLSGDSGKTVVSLGLLLMAREKGLAAAAFKKGPDYIDAAWLRWAAGSAARNLDSYLMGFEAVKESFARHALREGLNVIEGNRGLYDGFDAKGTHSTAELAKALGAPVLLVLNATKITRTAAALVLGCQRLDPAVRFAGVVLNQVAGKRHERVIRQAVEESCGLKVLGALPRGGGGVLLPGRHLGLVTPEEHPRLGELSSSLMALCRENLDWDAVMEASAGAPPIEPRHAAPAALRANKIRIGVVRDSAFTFYYPENIEALEALGAEIVPVSPLRGGRFPDDIRALYAGGGFPETHAHELSVNREWLEGLRLACEKGLPVYAECGGLMLLSKAIHWQGSRYEMAGALPHEVAVHPSPQGHGYAEIEVDCDNAFFAVGTRIRGHEFHYSALTPSPAVARTACRVARGAGVGGGRDAVVANNVWAAYTHIHASATPEWAPALIAAASRRERHFTTKDTKDTRGKIEPQRRGGTEGRL